MTKLATVSYLNARPLIDGLEDETGIEVIRRVPSRLLETLEEGDAEIALCPVIDYQRSTAPLEIVPAGAIGCDGPALTVKLFSRRPLGELGTIWVDGESHTSVALLKIVMHELFDLDPTILPLESGSKSRLPDAILLIGDKVIHAAADLVDHEHRIDLGQAWKQLSDKPFVFAVWMTRAGSDLGDLPKQLERLRLANRPRLAEIAQRHARSNGWTAEMATEYLGSNLRYELGSPETAGIEEFWRRCRELEIIEELRPLRLYGVNGES